MIMLTINNFYFTLMWNLLIESIIIGVITAIIGKITFNLTANKYNYHNKKEKNKPFGIEIAFFITGLLIHIILEYVGVNKWYCDKKFCSGLKKLNN